VEVHPQGRQTVLTSRSGRHNLRRPAPRGRGSHRPQPQVEPLAPGGLATDGCRNLVRATAAHVEHRLAALHDPLRQLGVSAWPSSRTSCSRRSAGCWVTRAPSGRGSRQPAGRRAGRPWHWRLILPTLPSMPRRPPYKLPPPARPIERVRCSVCGRTWAVYAGKTPRLWTVVAKKVFCDRRPCNAAMAQHNIVSNQEPAVGGRHRRSA
jgi:hypothetical protein